MTSPVGSLSLVKSVQPIQPKVETDQKENDTKAIESTDESKSINGWMQQLKLKLRQNSEKHQELLLNLFKDLNKTSPYHSISDFMLINLKIGQCRKNEKMYVLAFSVMIKTGIKHNKTLTYRFPMIKEEVQKWAIANELEKQ